MVTLFPKSLHKTSITQNPHRTSKEHLLQPLLQFVLSVSVPRAASDLASGVWDTPVWFQTSGGERNPMTDPWDEQYIYPHERLIFMVHVGKYTMVCIHESHGVSTGVPDKKTLQGI